MTALLLLAAATDLYAPAFMAELRERASAACRQGQDEFRIEQPWTTAQVARVRKVISTEHEGKQLYVQFLKDRYGYSIDRVNEIYRLDSGSFTDLLISDFKNTDGERKEVRADDEAFLAILGEHVERLAAEAWTPACPADKRRPQAEWSPAAVRFRLR